MAQRYTRSVTFHDSLQDYTIGTDTFVPDTLVLVFDTFVRGFGLLTGYGCSARLHIGPVV